MLKITHTLVSMFYAVEIKRTAERVVLGAQAGAGGFDTCRIFILSQLR